MISFIWSWNVKKVAFGTLSDRIVYASGAAFGSIVGLLVSTLILK
jgi:membrane associated rhomboid family serine protease